MNKQFICASCHEVQTTKYVKAMLDANFDLSQISCKECGKTHVIREGEYDKDTDLFKHRAALLDINGDVIGEVFDAPRVGFLVKVAGGFTVNGEPYNCRFYKISRSKVNLEKARYEPPLSKFGEVYTFDLVEDRPFGL